MDNDTARRYCNEIKNSLEKLQSDNQIANFSYIKPNPINNGLIGSFSVDIKINNKLQGTAEITVSEALTLSFDEIAKNLVLQIK